MSRLNILLAIIPLSAGLLASGEPFSLRLAGLSEAWFGGGSVIDLPSNMSPCAEIQVLLAKPWAQYTSVDQLSVKLDSPAPKPSRLTSADGLMLAVRTREPIGLLTRNEHHIRASSMAKPPLQAEWTIVRWNKPYIRATQVSAHGVPLDIAIERPAGGVLLPDAAGHVRFIGEVLGSSEARLTIAGQSAPRLMSLAGFHFDQQISVAPGTNEITLVASDGAAGDSTTLVLPVLQPPDR